AESPWAVQHLRARLGRVVVLNRARERLTVVTCHARLGIEQVEMTGPALHEERDHRPRLRFVMRRLGQKIEATRLQLRPARRREQAFLIEQPGESESADAHGAARQKMTAGTKTRRRLGGMHAITFLSITPVRYLESLVSPQRPQGTISCKVATLVTNQST